MKKNYYKKIIENYYKKIIIKNYYKKIVIKKFIKNNIKKIIIMKIFFPDTHKFFLSKHIIMVNLTTHELRLITSKRGIKNYKNMSR